MPSVIGSFREKNHFFLLFAGGEGDFTKNGRGGGINPEKVGKEQLSYYWFRVKGTRMAVKQED